MRWGLTLAQSAKLVSSRFFFVSLVHSQHEKKHAANEEQIEQKQNAADDTLAKLS